jgi:DNA-binding HxlR family transcriptional regulator
MLPAGGGEPDRLLVMASCLTSDLHGAVLGALDAGATNLDEVAANLHTGVPREKLVLVLRELRSAGFVGRFTETGPPLCVLYRLTGDGEKMIDLTTFVTRWLSRTLADDTTEFFWAGIRNVTARPPPSAAVKG